jgi:hypothetical protein
MSIRPVKFNDDGSIDVVFDETGHTGTISAENIKYSKLMDGSDNHNSIVLECPDGCGSSSTWPVGGGADAVMGQTLFVKKAHRDGCGCGHVEAGDEVLATSHVRLAVNRTDGPGRWQYVVPEQQVQVRGFAAAVQEAGPGEFTETVQEANPDEFLVIYRDSDRMVIGAGPEGEPGAGYTVQAIAAEEYDNLMRFDPAYLSQDNKVVSSL